MTEPSTHAERIEAATRYVAERADRPEFAATPVQLQLDAITGWLEPLPASRWSVIRRRRHTTTRVGPLAQAVHDRLQPPAGTRPQPTCPVSCWVTHGLDQDEVA